MNALFVAWWPGSRNGRWRPVGRLDRENGIYRFLYTRGARKPEFRPFPRMDDLEQIYESDELFPVFANRLLAESRPEYKEFLQWAGFDADSPPEPIVILGVTEGIRQTDALEVFPCPQPDGEGCYLNRFFLHGIRWLPDFAIDRISQLQNGEELKMLYDIQNENDPLAVAVRTRADRTLVGYIPRYLARDVWNLCLGCGTEPVQIWVERVNPKAPLQNRVLCKMRGCWPEDFIPCSGEDFVPIPEVVPA